MSKKQADETIRIALFNHKGGVGKTTLTVNLAYALAALGKKVLLIDSDPQCNLTSYLVSADVVDKWLDESEGKSGQTVWTALNGVISEGGQLSYVKPYERADNIYLLPGDIKMSEFERDLQQSWVDCLQRKIRGFQETTALSRLAGACAKSVGADYVMYDVGPNIGALNRAILLDCDYFIVPAACDYFSVRALKTLGQSIKSWIKDWDIVSKLAPDRVPLLRGHPVYAGFVLQKFRMYGGVIASTYREQARLLERHSYSDIVAVLREISDDLAPGSPSDFRLGEIKDFASVANGAQEQGVPFWLVEGGSASNKVEAKSVFLDFAKKVLNRIGG